MAWFIKIERGTVDKAIFDQHVPAHKAYVQQLSQQGHQARTGYWRNSPGGMLIFCADSLEEAIQLVEADPLIANHCVEYDLHEWIQVSGEPL